MSYLRVKNFWKYQNADAWKKARENKGGHKHPAWCKLHVSRDLELEAEKPIVRLVFYELLRLATIHANAIPNDSELIAKLISITPKEVAQAIDVLLKGAWLSETRSKRSSREPSRKFLAQIEIEEREEKSLEPAEKSPTNGQPRASSWVPNLNSYTGCRMVRGEIGTHNVYDVLGQDYPPVDWPYERPTRQEVRAALDAL